MGSAIPTSHPQVKVVTFKLVKEYLKGWIQITCSLINFPLGANAFCMPTIDGVVVAAIPAGASQTYVVDPGSRAVVVGVGPAGQWAVAPYNTRPYVYAGRTATVVASFRYTAPPATPTPIPPPPGGGGSGGAGGSGGGAAVCDCTGNIYNCDDFATHSQAQACFEYCLNTGHGDVHGLDGDNDGSACEALP
jgi:hypothetical protein